MLGHSSNPLNHDLRSMTIRYQRRLSSLCLHRVNRCYLQSMRMRSQFAFHKSRFSPASTSRNSNRQVSVEHCNTNKHD